MTKSFGYKIAGRMALTKGQILLAVAMLATGSINTLTQKAQNQCSANGSTVGPYANETMPAHPFSHPWFQAWIMFIGEFLVLFVYACYRRNLQKQLWDDYIIQIKSSTSYPPEPPAMPGYIAPIFFITGFFDIIGSSLAAIGLIYIDASVWMMFRGSMIIFAGFLSCIFLKKKMGARHWLGIGVTAIGLVLVGLASILRPKPPEDHGKTQSLETTLIGIMLVVIGQLLSASQMVLQELFMKKNPNVHPMQVVGTEGLFGFVAMSAIFLPAFYFIKCPGSRRCEDALDAFFQIYNSPQLLAFCLCYICSIAFYNFLGIAVTKSLSAVHRCIIDGCRTLCVWLVNLFIFYAIERSLDPTAGPNFGEEFDTSYGFLQIDGFLFLIIGSALYNEIIDLPCWGSAAASADTETNTEEAVDTRGKSPGSINGFNDESSAYGSLAVTRSLSHNDDANERSRLLPVI